MKVIFLDNDGVICLANNWGNRYKKIKKWESENPSLDIRKINPLNERFDNFDSKAIIVLNTILEETGAEIVVSSDWKRHASVEELGKYYMDQGIIKKPIDTTPFAEDLDLPTQENFAWSRNEGLEQERHFEILEWLKLHPEVTHWVAVDDLNMGIHVEASSWGPFDREWGLKNFVWTPHDNEGIKQCSVKEKILKFME